MKKHVNMKRKIFETVLALLFFLFLFLDYQIVAVLFAAAFLIVLYMG